jgi:selenocysteine lyase/cysteine desulfurase
MKNGHYWSRRKLLAGAVGSALAVAGSAVSLAAQNRREQSPDAKAKPEQPPVNISVPGIDAFRLSGAPDENYWKRLREQFILDPEIAFFNTGTYAPTPRFVIDARQKYDLEMARDPRNSFRSGELDAARRHLAALVNAGDDEIALTHATTDGMNIFAAGIDWKPGDEVIIGRHEHFGPVAAYEGLEKRHGIKIVQVDTPSQPRDAEQIVSVYEKAFTSKTRVILVSHVMYITGLQTPLRELADLAHRRGALISVDGVQALGAVRFDAKETGVDHYAAGGQKWLLAGSGTGFVYVKKDIQSRVWPRNGFVADESARNASARRYENTGQLNIPAYVGLAAAAELQTAIGPANIEARVHQLAGQLRRGLRDIPGARLWTSDAPEFSAGLTTFSVEKFQPNEILRALEDEKIYARTVNSADVQGVRISTHIYNSPDEIDRLLAVLKKTIAAKGILS